MIRVRISSVVFFAVLGCLIFCANLKAQEATTSLRGTVTDATGGIVPGAKVTLTDPSRGFSRETSTSKDGAYEFLLLRPASYDLTVAASGFKTRVQKQITLLVSTPATVNVKLEIGEVTQSVTVNEASEPALNTTDATLGNAFGTTQIERLPFDGRNPVEILSLQPGVLFIDDTPNGPTGVDRTVDSRNGSVNGGRSDQANITLDGVDNNDQLSGFAFEGALRSTLDSTEEFRVTTANGNADEGRSSGAQVNLVTKSGTNTFHGSLYDYNRNIYGRANEWFTKNSEQTSNPPLPNHPGTLVRNVFGGSIGGPIKKDRTFFFFNYEGKRQAEEPPIDRSVPSDAFRDGVIIYHCATDMNGNPIDMRCNNPPPVQGINGPHNIPPGFFGLTPAQLASMDMGSVGTTCLNANKWGPGCGPSVAVLAAMQIYPRANNDTLGDALNLRAFSFPSPQPKHDNTTIAKLDYNLTSNGNHRLFVRANYQDDHEFGALFFPGQPAEAVSTSGNKGLAVGYTAVLSPTHINNFHYGYIRQSFGENGDNSSTHAVVLRGIDDLNTSNGQFFTRTTATIVPVHNLIDDFTWIRGKHTIQIGGNLRIIGDDRLSNANSFFSAQTSVLSIGSGKIANQGVSLDPGAHGFPAVNADFGSNYDFAAAALMGLVAEFDGVFNFDKRGNTLPEGTPVRRRFRAHELEEYLQDSWRIKPNLTLTFGARYSFLQPPYETTGLQVAPTTSLHDWFATRAKDQKLGISFDPLITFDLAGQANGKKPYWDWDYKNLAPRLALAWSPNWSDGFLGKVFGGPGKSSIRVGYGIYFDHFGEGIINTFDQNGSFGLTTQLTNAFGVLTVDDTPRFVDRFTIPPAYANQVLVTFPTGGFPATPISDPLQGIAITWGLDDKIKTPYSHALDFSIERDLGHNYSIDVAYVGRLGRRLLDQSDYGMPLDLTDAKSGVDYFAAATQFSKLARAGTDINSINATNTIPYWENMFPLAVGQPAAGLTIFGAQCANGAYPANPTATQAMYELFTCFVRNEVVALQQADAFCVPACSGAAGTPLQYFSGQYGSLYTWATFARSDYHAMEISLRKKMSSGLLFDFNYTFSKSTDLGSDTERIKPVGGFNSEVVNAWSPNLQHGISDFDTRHQFNLNWVWEFPVGRGHRFASDVNRGVDAVIGGWEFSGLSRWTSGFPFSIQNGAVFPTNFNLPGQAVQIGPTPKTGAYFVPIPGASGRAINVFKDPATAIKSFDFPFPGQAGNRNNLRGPGNYTTDLSLQKAWNLGESRSLRLGWDVFNVTNSVRFDAANTFPFIDTLPTFGNYSNTLNDSRKMQFSLRFEF